MALFIACLLALLGLSHAGAALAEGGVHMITLDQAGQTSAADEEELEGDVRLIELEQVKPTRAANRGAASAIPWAAFLAAVAGLGLGLWYTLWREKRCEGALVYARAMLLRGTALLAALLALQIALYALAVLAALLRGALGRLGLSFFSAPTLVSLAGLLALLAPRYVAREGVRWLLSGPVCAAAGVVCLFAMAASGHFGLWQLLLALGVLMVSWGGIAILLAGPHAPEAPPMARIAAVACAPLLPVRDFFAALLPKCAPEKAQRRGERWFIIAQIVALAGAFLLLFAPQQRLLFSAESGFAAFLSRVWSAILNFGPPLALLALTYCLPWRSRRMRVLRPALLALEASLPLGTLMGAGRGILLAALLQALAFLIGTVAALWLRHRQRGGALPSSAGEMPFGGADAARAKLGLRQALRDGNLPAILDRVGLLASLACFFGCFFIDVLLFRMDYMPWSYIISDYWHDCFDGLVFDWSGFMSALPVLLDGLLYLLPPLSAALAAIAFIQRIRKGESRLTLPAALALALAVTQEIGIVLHRSFGVSWGAGMVFFALLTLAPLVLLAISPLRALLKERRRLLDCVGIAAATLNIALLRNASIGWPARRFGGYPRYWIEDMLEELSPVGFDFAAWLGQFGAVLVYLLPLAGSVIILLRLARSLRGKRSRVDVALVLLAAAAFFAQLTPAYRGWEVSGGFFAMTAVALLALVSCVGSYFRIPSSMQVRQQAALSYVGLVAALLALALAVLVPNFDSAYFPGGLSWLQVVWNFSMVMGRIGDGPVAMLLFMLAVLGCILLPMIGALNAITTLHTSARGGRSRASWPRNVLLLFAFLASVFMPRFYALLDIDKIRLTAYMVSALLALSLGMSVWLRLSVAPAKGEKAPRAGIPSLWKQRALWGVGGAAAVFLACAVVGFIVSIVLNSLLSQVLSQYRVSVGTLRSYGIIDLFKILLELKPPLGYFLLFLLGGLTDTMVRLFGFAAVAGLAIWWCPLGEQRADSVKIPRLGQGTVARLAQRVLAGLAAALLAMFAVGLVVFLTRRGEYSEYLGNGAGAAVDLEAWGSYMLDGSNGSGEALRNFLIRSRYPTGVFGAVFLALALGLYWVRRHFATERVFAGAAHPAEGEAAREASDAPLTDGAAPNWPGKAPRDAVGPSLAARIAAAQASIRERAAAPGKPIPPTPGQTRGGRDMRTVAERMWAFTDEQADGTQSLPRLSRRPGSAARRAACAALDAKNAQTEERVPQVSERSVEAQEDAPQVPERSVEAQEDAPQVSERSVEAQEDVSQPLEASIEAQEDVPQVSERSVEAQEDVPQPMEASMGAPDEDTSSTDAPQAAASVPLARAYARAAHWAAPAPSPAEPPQFAREAEAEARPAAPEASAATEAPAAPEASAATETPPAAPETSAATEAPAAPETSAATEIPHTAPETGDITDNHPAMPQPAAAPASEAAPEVRSAAPEANAATEAPPATQEASAATETPPAAPETSAATEAPPAAPEASTATEAPLEASTTATEAPRSPSNAAAPTPHERPHPAAASPAPHPSPAPQRTPTVARPVPQRPVAPQRAATPAPQDGRSQAIPAPHPSPAPQRTPTVARPVPQRPAAPQRAATPAPQGSHSQAIPASHPSPAMQRTPTVARPVPSASAATAPSPRPTAPRPASTGAVADASRRPAGPTPASAAPSRSDPVAPAARRASQPASPAMTPRPPATTATIDTWRPSEASRPTPAPQDAHPQTTTSPRPAPAPRQTPPAARTPQSPPETPPLQAASAHFGPAWQSDAPQRAPSSGRRGAMAIIAYIGLLAALLHGMQMQYAFAVLTLGTWRYAPYLLALLPVIYLARATWRGGSWPGLVAGAVTLLTVLYELIVRPGDTLPVACIVAGLVAAACCLCTGMDTAPWNARQRMRTGKRTATLIVGMLGLVQFGLVCAFGTRAATELAASLWLAVALTLAVWRSPWGQERV